MRVKQIDAPDTIWQRLQRRLIEVGVKLSNQILCVQAVRFDVPDDSHNLQTRRVLRLLQSLSNRVFAREVPPDEHFVNEDHQLAVASVLCGKEAASYQFNAHCLKVIGAHGVTDAGTPVVRALTPFNEETGVVRRPKWKSVRYGNRFYAGQASDSLLQLLRRSSLLAARRGC